MVRNRQFHSRHDLIAPTHHVLTNHLSVSKQSHSLLSTRRIGFSDHITCSPFLQFSVTGCMQICRYIVLYSENNGYTYTHTLSLPPSLSLYPLQHCLVVMHIYTPNVIQLPNAHKLMPSESVERVYILPYRDLILLSVHVFTRRSYTGFKQ